MNSVTKSLIGGVALLWLALEQAAPPVNTLKPGLLGGRSEVAILGYDPVAYFTDARPVKGSDAYVHNWNGARWKFASQEHLDRFKAEPEAYAPRYGGYCAYGVTRGYLVKIDPSAWAIVDGKLYLNYDRDVQKQWDADRAGFIRTADAKYPELLKED